jgi:hypothetical protein
VNSALLMQSMIPRARNRRKNEACFSGASLPIVLMPKAVPLGPRSTSSGQRFAGGFLSSFRNLWLVRIGSRGAIDVEPVISFSSPRIAVLCHAGTRAPVPTRRRNSHAWPSLFWMHSFPGCAEPNSVSPLPTGVWPAHHARSCVNQPCTALMRHRETSP